MEDGDESVMEDGDEARWVRLGGMVRDTRIRRGYRTQKALAQVMGVSSKLINNIELGKNRSYSQSSLIRLEAALGWQRGSVGSVLAGGEPVEDENPAPHYDFSRLADLARLRRHELGLSQSEVAERGELPDTVVEQVESGIRPLNPQMLLSLDVGLGWLQGSSLGVLEGLDPQLRPGPRLPPQNPTDAAYRAARAPHPRTRRRLGDWSYEDLFDRWARLFAQSLAIEMEYVRRRGLSRADEARAELWEALVMADQGREGRPWVPPWEEMSADEGRDHIDSLREAGLIDERGEPIEQEDDTPPHPIPEPELDDGYLRDLGAAAREGDDSEPRPSDPDM